jgi:hypothetical protein
MAVAPVLVAALRDPASAVALGTLDACGELTRLVPELEEGRAFLQPDLHHFDVLDHNLAAVAACDAVLGTGEDGREFRAALSWIDIDASLAREVDGFPVALLTRLGCLLHDVAKPRTAVREDGRLRFPRHGPRGAELMAERLPELGFGPAAVALVTSLIRYHLRPRELVQSWPPSDRAIRRFATDLDGHVLPLMLVNLADGMATRGPRYTRDNLRRHCQFANYVLARVDAVFDPDAPPLLGGEELMAFLGLESGPLIGRVLTSIRQAQLDGAISNRDEALELARRVVAGPDAAAR